MKKQLTSKLSLDDLYLQAFSPRFLCELDVQTALISLAVGVKANVICSWASTHTSQRSQGICQEYSERLDLIQPFLSPGLVV